MGEVLRPHLILLVKRNFQIIDTALQMHFDQQIAFAKYLHHSGVGK
jgi:hypothetical protein